jgi:hypothetical protein
MRYAKLGDMKHLMPMKKEGDLLKAHAHFLNINYYYKEIQNLQS